MKNDAVIVIMLRLDQYQAAAHGPDSFSRRTLQS